MKIKFLLTGGTIGSAIGADGFIAPDKGTADRLLSLQCCAGVEFDVETPYTILSERLSGKYLMLLADAVNQALAAGCYDGVLIAHGTDTLQYSAAMLSLLFPAVRIPVLFVSSDYILDDVRANGYDNFRCAVQYIRDRGNAGIWVSYHNQEDIYTRLHHGAKLLWHRPFCASLYSLSNQYYAEFDETQFQYNPEYRRQELYLHESAAPDYKNIPENSNVLLLHIYPGMVYPLIEKEVKAVVLCAYHSGTLCDDSRFEEFTDGLRRRGIACYLSGFSQKEAAYETTKLYQSAGIHLLPEESPVLSYCRLWLTGADTK